MGKITGGRRVTGRDREQSNSIGMWELATDWQPREARRDQKRHDKPGSLRKQDRR
jgi:hypothetical protein